MTEKTQSFDLIPFKPSLFQAIETKNEAEIERIMTDIVQLAYDNNLNGNDIIDILAAHEILPGKGFHEWVMQEYRLAEIRARGVE